MDAMMWSEYLLSELKRRAGAWFTTLELIDMASTQARKGRIRAVPSTLVEDQAWGAVPAALRGLHQAGNVERRGTREITARWRIAMEA